MQALTCSKSSISLHNQAPASTRASCTRPLPPNRKTLAVQSQSEEKQAAAASEAEPAASYRREFRSLGSQVIESSDAFENPPEKDPWEDPKWENLGQFGEKYFLPTLVVLGLVCGGIAAGTYNNGADTFIKAAPGEEESMIILPADALKPPPQ